MTAIITKLASAFGVSEQEILERLEKYRKKPRKRIGAQAETKQPERFIP